MPYHLSGSYTPIRLIKLQCYLNWWHCFFLLIVINNILLKTFIYLLLSCINLLYICCMKIEKNIPIPERKYKYPFMELNINQSFAVGIYTHELQRNMNSLCSYYEKKTGNKFVARQDDELMLRVWRVK